MLGRMKKRMEDEQIEEILQVKTKKNAIIASDCRIRKAAAICDTFLDQLASIAPCWPRT
jgi:hypothetical protein